MSGGGAPSQQISSNILGRPQFSPSLDRMPQLKQLVLGAETTSSSSVAHQQNTTSSGRYDAEQLDVLLVDDLLPNSVLGQAVINVHTAWTQLIIDLTTRTGFAPPSLEHIKEVAECAIRQLKDACHDLTREFAHVGLEWRLTHPEEASAEDLADYDQAILRQETILGRAAGIVQRRLDDFEFEQGLNRFD